MLPGGDESAIVPASQTPRLDKKRTVLLLRSVVIFTTSYLVLFGPQPPTAANVAYVALLVASQIALAVCPRYVFEVPQCGPALLLADTGVVLVGLYQTAGFSQEFLIVYFFTIFLTTTGETLAQISVGATLISGLYGYWMWLSADGPLDASQWLRLPFFFVVAIFYAFLTDELKVEKRRRHQAEREREHLRLLLQVTGAVSRSGITSECLKSVGKLIEDTFSHLRCEVSLGTSAGGDARGTVWLPIEAYEERFGGLRVRSITGQVTADERAVCQLVIHAAASALYTVRQMEVAQQAARLKEEFVATLSHELRTPLHAIVGYCDLIENVADPAAQPLIVESAQRLRANARRLHDLLEEMLGFALLRTGQATPHIAPVRLPSIVTDVAAATEDLLAGRPIEFKLEMPAELPPVWTDASKLRQVLASLLSNAAKFTEKGTVGLALEVAQPDQLAITVSDTGIGIAPADLPVIFDEFRQVDASASRRFGGVGLGLALARGMTTLLGGTLEVSSRPKEGSSFRVTLPLGCRVTGGSTTGPCQGPPVTQAPTASSHPTAAAA